MKNETVKYDGRLVPKDGFRAYVYGLNNTSKIANSWDEYVSLIQSGAWFSAKKDVTQEKVKIKKGGD